MNCAGVVNCACENKDRAGVNANCVGVDLDEICTCLDDPCFQCFSSTQVFKFT